VLHAGGAHVKDTSKERLTMEFFPLEPLEQILISINEFFGMLLHNGSSSLAISSAELGLI